MSRREDIVIYIVVKLKFDKQQWLVVVPCLCCMSCGRARMCAGLTWLVVDIRGLYFGDLAIQRLDTIGRDNWYQLEVAIMGQSASQFFGLDCKLAFDS